MSDHLDDPNPLEPTAEHRRVVKQRVSRRRALRGAGSGLTVIAVVAGLVLATTMSGHPITPSTNPGISTSAPDSTTTSTTTTSTALSTSTASTTTPATTTCQPSQLQIVQSGYGGAAGTIELTFSLTNRSTTPCRLHGYPGALLLDASMHPVPTTAIRGGGLAFENIAETQVSLPPGHLGYFNLGYSDVVTGTTSCSQGSILEITPPNDTASALVPVAPSPRGLATGSVQ